MMKTDEKFVMLTETELVETDGGGTALVIAGAIVCVCVGVGIYNGYNDTMDQKK